MNVNSRHKMKKRIADLPVRSKYTAAGWLATALLGLSIVLFWPGTGRANDYGGFIQIETEEDLLDLLTAQEIDEDAYQTLLELLADYLGPCKW